MTTPVLGLSEIAEGVVSQAVVHNTALRQFEARTVRVLSRATGTPPGSPAEGDSYIIPAGATGVWASKTDQIASWIGGGWSYYTPIEGVGPLWVNDENAIVNFSGTAWVLTGGSTAPYITGGALSGKPGLNQVMLVHPMAIATSFPSGLANSKGYARVAATAQTDFDLRKKLSGGGAESSIGTMRFAAAAQEATFIFSSTVTFAIGDVLIVVGGTADATLADIGFSIRGTR